MTETVCVELTELGATGVPDREPGDRLLLPAQTARWFAERGYATVLDDLDADDQEADHARR